MSRTQMEMVMYLLLLGACLAVVFITIIRRNKGHKTPYDFIIITCSILCTVLGGMLGVMMT